MKRTLIGLMALMLSTSAVLATGIPVSCSDGTRNEPQDPTIIPAWVEVTPDIQHEGWVEEVPDILHPAEYANKTFGGGEVGVSYGNVTMSKYCGPEYADTGYQRPGGFCTQLSRFSTLASVGNTVIKPVQVAEEYVEVVDDIEHPAYVEDVPDIEHPEEVIPNPDLVIPTKTITVFIGFSGPPWNPKPVFQSHTTDGSCPPGL